MDIFETFTLIGTPVSIVGIAWGFLIYLPSKRQQEHDRAKEEHHHETVKKQQESEAHRIKVEHFFIKELEEKKIDIAQKDQLLTDLTKKYEELKQSYKENPTDIDLVATARKQALNLDFTSANEFLDKALKEEQSASNIKQASIYYEKGKIAHLQIEYQKAKTYFAKAVQLAPLTIKYLVEFGNILEDLGDYDLAQKQYIAALPIASSEEEKIGLSNNIGIIYTQKREYGHAVKALTQALKIHDEAKNKNYPLSASILNNLGVAFRRLEQFDEAIECTKKSLAIRINYFGDKHPETATSHNNLGTAYAESGEMTLAIEEYIKGLNIKIKAFGNEHPSTGRTHINLGVIYFKAGDLKKALDSTQKAFDIFSTTLPSNHPHIQDAQNNLETIMSAIAGKDTGNNSQS